MLTVSGTVTNLRAFLEGGVSIIAAPCISEARPCLTRAVGCGGHGDGRVLLYLPTTRSGPVLEAVQVTAEMNALGYTESFAHALVRFEAQELTCVTFTPSTIFDQTPGPGAGNAMAVQ